MISVFYNIADAAQVMSLIKIHIQKIRHTYSPALRYGTSSHVFVSRPRHGDPATLILTKGDVMLVPSLSEARDARGTEQRMVHFNVSSPRFFTILSVLAVFAIIWLVTSITLAVLEAVALRPIPNKRCWEKLPHPKSKSIVESSLSPLAAMIVFSLCALIKAFGLGSAIARWIAFWYRCNWVLVFVCALRGLTFIRPEFAYSDSVGTVINVSFFLCIVLSSTDFLLILGPSRLFRVMYGLFLFSQAYTFATSYIIGSSLEAPCDKTKMARSPWLYVINKIQSSIILFHSLYYMQLLFRVKAYEGLSVPIVNFSEERFSELGELPRHRMSRLVSEGPIIENRN